MSKSALAPAPVKEVATQPSGFTSPFALMRSLSDELDRVFGDVGLKRRWPFAALAPDNQGILWSPDLEIEQRDGKLIVHADLPGLSKGDVKVDVTNDVLTIEGERKQESEKKGDGYYRSERSYGRFRRSLVLPEGAKADSAKASFTDGVLEITVEAPTPAAASTRHVDIQ